MTGRRLSGLGGVDVLQQRRGDRANCFALEAEAAGAISSATHAVASVPSALGVVRPHDVCALPNAADSSTLRQGCRGCLHVYGPPEPPSLVPHSTIIYVIEVPEL